MPAVTFTATEHHRSLHSTKLHCCVTGTRVCTVQFAQSHAYKWNGWDLNPQPLAQCQCPIHRAMPSDHPEIKPLRAKQAYIGYADHWGCLRSSRWVVSVFSTVFASSDYETVETGCKLCTVILWRPDVLSYTQPAIQSNEIHEDTTGCTVTAIFHDAMNKQMSKLA